ncbi:MAG: C39 family peptidase [Candidatus Pacebacteria bacterium]|nr:C39 family peptidase [Candidatus Paceibacterota bacterium]
MNFQINYKILFVFCALILISAYFYVGTISDEPLPPYTQLEIENGGSSGDSGIITDDIEGEKRDDSNEIGNESEILPEEIDIPRTIIIKNVPFASQAPFGDWEDPRQQHGCEEASLLMAYYWILGKPLSPDKALEEIITISEFEDENFSGAYDLSIADTLKLWNEYFASGRAFTKYDISLEDIKKELAEGNLVIVPINGVKLQNPHYTAPGPEFHEMIVIGYDDRAGEFITHDPGTRYGANYHYDYNIFMDSIRDYKTGFNEPVDEVKKAMLVVGKG